MNKAALVEQFTVTNQVGLESHGGRASEWTEAQLALLRDTMLFHANEVKKCLSHTEGEDQEGRLSSARLRTLMLSALLEATRSTLQTRRAGNEEIFSQLSTWESACAEYETQLAS